MTQIERTVEHFFSKNPDVKGARDKGLVNRRALARYLIKAEGLNVNQTESVVSALRRFKKEKDESKDLLSLFKEIKVTTKDRVSIISIEKSVSTIQKLQKVLSNINYAKNETLKIVDGYSTIKIFVDESNVKGIKELFSQKEILKIYNKIAEITITFPESSIKTKGIISYVTSELSINKINIFEILTSTPELIIYVEEKDLIKAYETVKSMG